MQISTLTLFTLLVTFTSALPFDKTILKDDVAPPKSRDSIKVVANQAQSWKRDLPMYGGTGALLKRHLGAGIYYDHQARVVKSPPKPSPQSQPPSTQGQGQQNGMGGEQVQPHSPQTQPRPQPQPQPQPPAQPQSRPPDQPQPQAQKQVEPSSGQKGEGPIDQLDLGLDSNALHKRQMSEEGEDESSDIMEHPDNEDHSDAQEDNSQDPIMKRADGRILIKRGRDYYLEDPIEARQWGGAKELDDENDEPVW